MHDITPDKSGHWSRIEVALADIFSRYGYREIRLPIVEKTGLFSRSIGEVTDIIEKEMYTFSDRNDEKLSLRPEGTAGCVRACIEHSLLEVPQKLWYKGPMFRYERPQKGRQRQFHQIGGEVFGFPEVEIEAEVLLMNQRFWQALGLGQGVTLQLNNIGSSDARASYRSALVNYLSQHLADLDEESQRRINTNPLRILDSKSAQTQAVVADAPSLTDFISDESQQRMIKLQALLASQGVEVEHNPRLIRGLDYYNDTVFEWVSDQLGAQATVCAGGRYDGLVNQLGGRPTPAFGFAMGLERLYLLLEAQQFAALGTDQAPDIYLIVAASELQPQAFLLAERLRSALPEFVIMQHLQAGSMKSQFKKADKSGAQLALILGEDEAEKQQIGIKNLATGEQEQCSTSDELQALIARLKYISTLSK
jgi:histidyl-tRNA synthetase